MTRGPAPSTRAWRLAALEVFTLVAWAGLALVVFGLTPEPVASKVAFFGAFGLAAWTTASLAAYALSHRLFLDPQYRGNLDRSLRQGAVVAVVLVVAALLQMWRALTPLASAILLGIFLAGQIAALLRE